MTEQYRAEIIAVGTELLLGQIVNSNAQWISKQLALYGIDTYYHTVVGDNLTRLSTLFREANKRSNLIIVTGGLGPTEDDMSREAFQTLSNIPLTIDSAAMERIERHYEKQAQPMTENNRRQARIFEGSVVLENTTGMAPGNLVEYGDTKWIFLPGVPREMKQIFTDYVTPILSEISGSMIIDSKVLNFTGIGESKLEDLLIDLIKEQKNPTIAPLAKKTGVTIRITAKASSIEETTKLITSTKQEILDRVGEYCFGEDDDTLATKIKDLLKERNWTISAAESITGGFFSHLLVEESGISAVFKGSVVCYDAEVKQDILDIPTEVIMHQGTVSRTCAHLLSKNISHYLNTDIGISFTGVAGPNEIEGKQVGMVYIGLFAKEGHYQVEKCMFSGNRQQIRKRAALKGLEMVYQFLQKTYN